MTNYRKGHSRLSDDHVIALCKILGESPVPHLVSMAIERAHTDKSRKGWQEVQRKIASVLCLCLAILLAPSEGQSKPGLCDINETPYTLYVFVPKPSSGT